MCIYPLIQLPILRFLNRLDFMSLQEQDICLQRPLLTLCTFFVQVSVVALQYFCSKSPQGLNMWSNEGVCKSMKWRYCKENCDTFWTAYLLS